MFKLHGRGGLVAPIAIALPLALGARPAAAGGAPYSEGHAALLATLEGVRPLAAPLTGVAYTPPSGRARPFDAVGDADQLLRFARAAALIEREHDEAPRPESTAALGVLRLVQDRIEEAIQLLASASGDAPHDGRILADLAAGTLERGQRERRVSDLASAVRLAEQAMAEGPEVEPRFTRALALEHLGLARAAREAWEGLADTAGEGWREEARRHAADLRRLDAATAWQRTLPSLTAAIDAGDRGPLVAAAAAFPQQMRTLAEDAWLGDWADAAGDGRDAEASRLLEALSAVGGALGELTGDTLLEESVTAVEEATAAVAAGDGSRLQRLSRAYRLYRDARALQEQERYSDSRLLLAEAAALFTQARSPFALWARYRGAVAVFHQPDHLRALVLFEGLGGEASGARRTVLAGHLSWMVGLTHMRLGEWTTALTDFDRASAAFAACQEVENRTAIHDMRVAALQALGREDEAEAQLVAVLTDLPRIIKPRRILNVLSTASAALTRDGEDATAVYFQDEVLLLAHESGNPNWIARAFWQRADLLRRAGLDARAEQDLEQALVHARRIAEPGERLNVEVAVLQVQARLAAAGSPARAIALLDRATTLADDNGLRFLLLDLLTQRATVKLAGGDFAAAERDLERGIAELDRQLREAANESDRSSLAEDGRRLLEMLVRLDVDAGTVPAAGRVAAERLRLRGLGDPLEAVRVTAALSRPPAAAPPRTAILEYLVLPDRLYTWLVLPDRVVFQQRPLAANALAVDVGEFVRALGDDEPVASRAPAARLRDLLLEILLPFLDRVSSLVVVPDRALWSLPFAALSLTDGTYLAEHLAIAVTASSTHYGGDPAAPRSSAAAGESLLVVAGDEAAVGGLSTLPAARREAEELAAIYGHATVLAGPQATAGRMLRELPRHAVFHFAGHTREAPAALALFDGVVTAADLPSGPLPQLVVLSGCRSASGPVSAARGSQSLARAFIARGVPEVIASLWDVEDDTARRFATELHAALHRGEAPAAALRSVQERFLRSADPLLRRPWAWSTYQLLAGGSAGDSKRRQGT